MVLCTLCKLHPYLVGTWSLSIKEGGCSIRTKSKKLNLTTLNSLSSNDFFFFLLKTKLSWCLQMNFLVKSQHRKYFSYDLIEGFVCFYDITEFITMDFFGCGIFIPMLKVFLKLILLSSQEV